MATLPDNSSNWNDFVRWAEQAIASDGSLVGIDADTLTALPAYSATAAVASTIDGTYGAEEQNVLTAERTRVAELVTQVTALRATVNEIKTVLIAMGATATP
jgi:hypothetical protein